jgi:predicted acylesterase/phospholipase RssA
MFKRIHTKINVDYQGIQILNVMQNSKVAEAIVIAGGGAKLYFEMGVLDALIRAAAIDPFAFLGVSAGALLSAVLAQGEGRTGLLESLDKLEDVAFSVQGWRDVYKKRPPASIIEFPGSLDELASLAFAPSIYKLDPLFNKIEANVSLEKLRNSGRKLRVGAVSLEQGRYHSIGPDNDNFLKFVRASASIPLTFDPVEIDGEYWVDGGVINVTPLADLFDLCKESAIKKVKVHVILASSREPTLMRQDKWGSIEVANRTLELLLAEIFRNDIEVAKLRNIEDETVQAEFVIYEPGSEGVDIGSLEFDPEKMRDAFDRGRRLALRIAGL